MREDNHKGAAPKYKKISKFQDVHIGNLSHHIENIVRSVSIQSDVKTNGRYEMQSRTNVHFLIFHLTLADAIVCFITMPMETIWRIVIEVVALQSQRKQNEEKHPETSSLSIIEVVVVKYLGKFHLQWYAGNLACKVLMMVRTGGFILIIKMIFVMISIR